MEVLAQSRPVAGGQLLVVREVRVEVELPDKALARTQLTRAQAAELEIGPGDVVYVKAPNKDRPKVPA